MKKLRWACLAVLIATGLKAQSPPSLIQVDTVQGPVAGCVTHAGVSTLCIGTDGLVFSQAGAAYGANLAKPSAPVAGVTSITVNGGAAQSGPVALVIPSKAVTTSTTTLQ